MNNNTKRTLAGYLVGAAISISSGNINAGYAQLQQFPIELVEDAIIEIAGKSWKTHEKMAVLSMAAHDSRASVRRSACEQLTFIHAQFEWQDMEPLLEHFASDKASSVRNEAAQALCHKLKGASCFDRIPIIADWAYSDSQWKRLAIAHALADDFQSLGIGITTSHLSMDPTPEVRLAVVNIAASRLKENPVFYKELLKKLSDDANRRVRRTARRVLTAIERL